MASFDLPRRSDSTVRLLELPGLRTFRSRSFRELAALALIAIGLLRTGQLLFALIADPNGQFAIDFGDYYGAAQALSDGGTPYAAAMLSGPVPSQGIGAYRYPPVFGQLLMPLTGLPMRSAAAAWFGVQAALIVLGVWLAGTLGGAARSRERFLWTMVACLYFLPAFDALWKGNVSGIVAFQVAVLLGGGFAGGLAVATAVLLKVSPVAFVPPLFLGRYAWSSDGATAARRGAVLAGVAIAFLSVALAPRAWLDYGRVLPNLLGGFVDYPTNLAPASLLVTRAPVMADLAPAVRLLTLGLALGAVALAVWMARRPGGWPAAVTAGTAAMLFLPSSIWYHYLVVLLPLAAFVWPRASVAGRATLVAGAGLIFGAFTWWLPLATPGLLVMLGGTLGIVWPGARPSASRGPTSGQPVVPTWIRRQVHPGSPVAPGPIPGIDD